MEDKTLVGWSIQNWFFWIAPRENNQVGQVDTDEALYDIVTITLYDRAHISFEIWGLNMTFEVNEDTADYLNGYFE